MKEEGEDPLIVYPNSSLPTFNPLSKSETERVQVGFVIRDLLG